jgi:hypothetical protein
LSGSEEGEILGAWSGFAYGSNCALSSLVARYYHSHVLTNFPARSKAGKAYALGWKPKHHTTGLFDSIDAEYDAVIEEGRDEAPKVHIDEMNKALGAV